MSWLIESNFVRWKKLKLFTLRSRTTEDEARKLIFSVVAFCIFIAVPAIFADTNIPSEFRINITPPATNAAAGTNTPFTLAATSFSNSVTAPTPVLNSRLANEGEGIVVTTNGSALVQTNLPTPPALRSDAATEDGVDPYVQKLENARYLRKTRQTKEVEPLLVSLLGNEVPEDIQKSALLELAAFAQDEQRPAARPANLRPIPATTGRMNHASPKCCCSRAGLFRADGIAQHGADQILRRHDRRAHLEKRPDGLLRATGRAGADRNSRDTLQPRQICRRRRVLFPPVQAATTRKLTNRKSYTSSSAVTTAPRITRRPSAARRITWPITPGHRKSRKCVSIWHRPSRNLDATTNRFSRY